jgi:hypothetical protein
MEIRTMDDVAELLKVDRKRAIVNNKDATYRRFIDQTIGWCG